MASYRDDPFRTVLLGLWTEFLNQMNGEVVLDRLNDVIPLNSHAYQKIRLPTNTLYEKNRLLLEAVSTRGPGTIQKMVKAMAKSGNCHPPNLDLARAFKERAAENGLPLELPEPDPAPLVLPGQQPIQAPGAYSGAVGFPATPAVAQPSEPKKVSWSDPFHKGGVPAELWKVVCDGLKDEGVRAKQGWGHLLDKLQLPREDIDHSYVRQAPSPIESLLEAWYIHHGGDATAEQLAVYLAQMKRKDITFQMKQHMGDMPSVFKRISEEDIQYFRSTAPSSSDLFDVSRRVAASQKGKGDILGELLGVDPVDIGLANANQTGHENINYNILTKWKQKTEGSDRYSIHELLTKLEEVDKRAAEELVKRHKKFLWP